MKLGLEIQLRLVPACAKISNSWSILADSSVQTCTIMAKRRTDFANIPDSKSLNLILNKATIFDVL